MRESSDQHDISFYPEKPKCFKLTHPHSSPWKGNLWWRRNAVAALALAFTVGEFVDKGVEEAHGMRFCGNDYKEEIKARGGEECCSGRSKVDILMTAK